MSISPAELCDRFEQLYPGAVADTLDALGYEGHTLPAGIGPLTSNMRMAGIAFPVRGQPDDEVEYDANIRNFLQMLSEAPPESALAYETNDERAAHIGELTVTALKEGDCRGAVLDGGARDIAYVLEQDFPVFTRYRTPLDAPPRWRITDWDVPVSIGEVEIQPRDVLVGDADGVVRVPRDVSEEVLTRAEQTVQNEDAVRSAIREGVDPLEAYERYGTF